MRKEKLSVCCNKTTYTPRNSNSTICSECENICAYYIFTDPEDIFCKCGEHMYPRIMSNIIDYHCIKSKFYNFWKHSFPIAFNRINEIKK